MAPLMHEPRLDGYVTLRNEKQDTIGSMRIVLAAEELGPVAGPLHKRTEHKEPALRNSCPGLEESFLLLKNNISQYLGNKAVAVQTETDAAARRIGAKNGEKEQRSALAAAAAAHPAPAAVHHEKTSVSFEPDCIKFSKDVMHSPVKADSKNDEQQQVRDHVEYELAWEFEMWRRSEEARWRAELKEKEMAAIKAVEEEAKRKALDQTAAMDKVRLELANLEAKLRTKLLAVEKRDRALILAEEAAASRKEALQRDCAQRVADAENTIKRVQADCQQKLEMERGKFVMLQQQYAALEQRLASTNANLAAVEKDFAAYKSAQRMSSEAELSGQIVVLKHQCQDLEKKADTAARARDEFKVQVIRLAKELAGMRKRPQEPESHALANLVESHLRKANEDKIELQRLKNQVERLQQQEQAALAAAAAAAAATTAARRANESAAREQKQDADEPGGSKQDSKESAPAASVKRATEPERKNPVPQKSPEATPPPPPPPPPVPSTTPAQKPWEVSPSPPPPPPPPPSAPPASLPPLPPRRDFYWDFEQKHRDDLPSFDDSEPFLSQITAFQRSEIVRLTKQKSDLLQTGVYTSNDRIIRGIDEEIRRLRSIDTTGLCSR